MGILTLSVGCFAQNMTQRTAWASVSLLLIGGGSKLVVFATGRRFVDRISLDGMSCAHVAADRRRAHSKRRGAFRFRHLSVLRDIRLATLVLQVSLGTFLYVSIQELRLFPKSDVKSENLGIDRAIEFLVISCCSLLVHSLVQCSLVFFSLFYALAGYVKHHSDDPIGGLAGRVQPEQKFMKGFMLEKWYRHQMEVDAGVTWYVHLNRHFFFDAEDALENKDVCGLPGYWFFSVKELLSIVRFNLPDAAGECHQSSAWSRSGKSGSKLSLLQCLESLLHLSQTSMTGVQLTDNTQYMHDLPQTSRCMHDVDAGRDFAQAGGYATMLLVMQSCRPDSEEVRCAASIVAGFAAGLSVLPWQPDRNTAGMSFILKMLTTDVFRDHTRQLFLVLFRLLKPRSPSLPAGKQLRVQEAAASAICSLTRVASDIHAHYHASKGQLEEQPETSRRYTEQVEPCVQPGMQPPWAQEAERVPTTIIDFEPPCVQPGMQPPWAQEAEIVPTTIIDFDTERCEEHGAARLEDTRLSNAFTTAVPDGWRLPTTIPDFESAELIWAADIVDFFLTEDKFMGILLDCLANTESHNVASACLRTLSSLFSCRMIYWHRFDMRMPTGFPPPLALIRDFVDNNSCSSDLTDRLKDLLLSCIEGGEQGRFVDMAKPPIRNDHSHMAKPPIRNDHSHDKDQGGTPSSLDPMVEKETGDEERGTRSHQTSQGDSRIRQEDTCAPKESYHLGHHEEMWNEYQAELRFSHYSQLELAKIFVSQGIRDIDKVLVEVLLQCLSYWASALGTVEVRWSATETIEVLRDLFRTSDHWDSLSPMLFPHLSSIIAKCLHLGTDDFNQFLRRVSSNCQASPSLTDAEACLCGLAASAAGLLGDLLNMQCHGGSPQPISSLLHPRSARLVEPQRSRRWSACYPGDGVLSKRRTAVTAPATDVVDASSTSLNLYRLGLAILPDPNITNDAIITLFNSLSFMTLCRISGDMSWHQVCWDMYGPARKTHVFRMTWTLNLKYWIARIWQNLKYTITAWIARIWQSLSNPVWLPGPALMESMNSDSTEGCEVYNMSRLERTVNAVLGRRNAVRVIEYVIQLYALQFDHEQLDVLVLPLVCGLRMHARVPAKRPQEQWLNRIIYADEMGYDRTSILLETVKTLRHRYSLSEAAKTV
ncbi:hypothetical protein CBR_g8712 [Chara braunii]|uniref:Uncharacterized protein n=1 Tax=Chara braunii TaxID=69332 RepID=A0A388KMK0_CHABU|nr:hypothetical protein CBR_g8710 [Chara braunii]GBG71291.1 hypothetical protein CBR_g8712 [Chara braunii]|eukprot:GBG71289.1 hypothetical protein CBR_g8710 [Chara braunii]